VLLGLHNLMERHFTREDKIKQLKDLESSLKLLIAHLKETGRFIEDVPVYEHALEVCRSYIENGFKQDQLNELGRHIPDLFSRHREWNPPTDERLSGEYGKTPAKWFIELEAVLQPTLKAAEMLPTIGVIL
jgi:hypothetical protein